MKVPKIIIDHPFIIKPDGIIQIKGDEGKPRRRHMVESPPCTL
jgi:hypothetical protein